MAVFICVHGTFTKYADWPALFQVISDAVEALDEPCEFEQVLWTGRNSMRARISASEKIAETVENVARRDPTGTIFLIGHSHGGSAIAYFWKQYPHLKSAISGCVFLSTPFIAIRQRPHLRGILLLGFAIPLVVTGALLYACEDYLRALTTLSKTSMWWLVWALQTVITGVLILGIAGIKEMKLDHLTDAAVKQQTANISSRHFLFLRFSGDEAAASLGFAQFVAWLSMKATKISAIFARPFERSTFTAYIFSLLVTSSLGIGISEAIRNASAGRITTEHMIWSSFQGGRTLELGMSTLTWIFVYVFFPVLIALIGLLSLTIVLPSVAAWAFGWSRLSRGFMIECSVEALPFGENRLVHLEWLPPSPDEQKPHGKWNRWNEPNFSAEIMLHSWTHSHPVAIRHVANWIKESVQDARSAQTKDAQQTP